jgi:hypothetical protein
VLGSGGRGSSGAGGMFAASKAAAGGAPSVWGMGSKAGAALRQADRNGSGGGSRNTALKAVGAGPLGDHTLRGGAPATAQEQGQHLGHLAAAAVHGTGSRPLTPVREVPGQAGGATGSSAAAAAAAAGGPPQAASGSIMLDAGDSHPRPAVAAAPGSTAGRGAAGGVPAALQLQYGTGEVASAAASGLPGHLLASNHS